MELCIVYTLGSKQGVRYCEFCTLIARVRRVAFEPSGEWDLAMATVPTEHYVVLTPAVANRTGQFWHRQPLLTSNFEIQFGFGVHGDDSAYIDFISSGGRKNRVTRPGGQQTDGGAAKGPGPLIGKPEGFALWYVYDEYARVYPKSKAEEKQWTLFGYKNRPRGLGVFFKVFDRYGQLRPSISVSWNDEAGTRVLDPIRDVPLPSGIFYRYRNLSEVCFRPPSSGFSLG